MSTHLDLALAHHVQAVADLAAAEAELLEVMTSIDPRPMPPIVDGILPRRFEALLEGKRPYWELSAVYSAFRKAQRAEAKASSAVCRAKLAAVPAAPPAPPAPVKPPRKKLPKKMSIGAYLEARAA